MQIKTFATDMNVSVPEPGIVKTTSEIGKRRKE